MCGHGAPCSLVFRSAWCVECGAWYVLGTKSEISSMLTYLLFVRRHWPRFEGTLRDRWLVWCGAVWRGVAWCGVVGLARGLGSAFCDITRMCVDGGWCGWGWELWFLVGYPVCHYHPHRLATRPKIRRAFETIVCFVVKVTPE